MDSKRYVKTSGLGGVASGRKKGRSDTVQTRQDKTRQDKTRQDKTGQDRTGQDRTGNRT